MTNADRLEKSSRRRDLANVGISIVKSVGEGIANNAKCVVVKYRAVGAGLQLSAPAPGGVEVHFID